MSAPLPPGREAVTVDPPEAQHPGSRLPDAAARTFWLKAVLALALAAGMLLSQRLWLTGRGFPLSPVLPWLPAMPVPLDSVWFWSMLLMLAAAVVLPRWRIPARLFLGLALVAALGDLNRWQPWVYQYCAMLGALCLLPEPDPDGRDEPALNVCRLIVAATYFWSGLQKCNWTFLSDTGPWLLQPLGWWMPAIGGWIGTMAYLVPPLEIGMGLGLLVPFLRSWIAPIAVVMHVMVLGVLGPKGHMWNTVVWPWNVAMALFVLILFARTPHVPARAVLGIRGPLYYRAVLVLFGVMPFFSLWGLWDAYLSAALYSGNTLGARVTLAPGVRGVPPAVFETSYAEAPDGITVDLFNWSIKELNVPAYPARRHYLSVARRLGAGTDRPEDVVLTVEERPDWRTGERKETTYPCGGSAVK